MASEHPTRLAIIEAMGHKHASPAQLAETLGVPLGNVSYHIDILRKRGVLLPTAERRVRNAVEHFYRVNHKKVCAACGRPRV